MRTGAVSVAACVAALHWHEQLDYALTRTVAVGQHSSIRGCDRSRAGSFASQVGTMANAGVADELASSQSQRRGQAVHLRQCWKSIATKTVWT